MRIAGETSIVVAIVGAFGCEISLPNTGLEGDESEDADTGEEDDANGSAHVDSDPVESGGSNEGGNGEDGNGVTGTGEGENGDTGESSETGENDETDALARWTFLIFMNGDSDLEHYVTSDLNILEGVGSGDGVHLVVQADRIPGYVTNDGDWTNTRRYYITKDNDSGTVSSKVVEDLGELDMGSPQTLSDFLLWAGREYPAERTVLNLWDHGDSWTKSASQSVPVGDSKSISHDSTSGSSLSIAEGDLNEGLKEYVERHGPLDVIAFDACLMASWEVAHSLQGYARYLDASESYVYDVGIGSADAVKLLRENPDIDSAALVDHMASKSVADGEVTYSAVNIDALDELSSAIDQLARAVLADGDLVRPLLKARDQAQGVCDTWGNWYLDLNDLGARLGESGNAVLRGHGEAIQRGIDTAVIGAYGNNRYNWTGGLTIMFDTDGSTAGELNIYSTGAGATWSQDTAWGELLQHLANR